MGKVAGAALKVAAPEAALAAKAAGRAGGKARKKAPLPDPRDTHPGSEAARQRQAVEDIKARRKPEPEEQDDEQQDQADEDGGGRLAPFAGMQGPATGGGFVLGVIVWAVVRAAIGGNKDAAGNELPGGAEGIKRLLRAKFLNKTN